MKRPVFIGALVAIALGLVAWRATRPLDARPSSSSPTSSTTTASSATTGGPTPRSPEDRQPSPPTSGGAGSSGEPLRPGASAVPSGVTSGAPIELGSAMLEAQKLDGVRASLAAENPRRALAELESYDRVVRNGGLMKHEASLLRVEALSRAGRRTDARALAYTLRDDPTFQDYQKRLDGLLADAGL